MNMKALVWGGFFIGSTIGSLLPILWNGSLLSFSSILLSAVGGVVGIVVGYQLGKYFGV